MKTIRQGIEFIQATDERYFESELYRLRGEIMMQQNDEKGAEVSLQTAVDVARDQKAKSWELRAATDLARLWESRGETEAAFQLLAPVYEWFSEGFDTPDYISAKNLLEESA